MTNGAVNLPIVIQQAGEVSRVQEQVQRVGEQQQMAAGAEVVREQAKNREAVQATQRSAADNRVRGDQRRQPGGQADDGAGGRRRTREGKDGDAPPSPESGGLVDVVV